MGRSDTAAAELRVGLVGLGKMGRYHLQVLRDLPDCRLVGVADPSPAAREGVDIGQPMAVRCQNHLELLAAARPDAVFVSVPALETYPVVADLLRAGVAVFVEKPAGLYAWQTEHLASLATVAGVPTMVGVNRRYYASLLAGRQALLAAGPVHSVTVEAHEDPAAVRASGRYPDAVVDRWVVANAIHALDLVRFFGGSVTRVAALQHRATPQSLDPGAACAAALVEFADGGVGRLLVDTCGPGGHRFEVRGNGVTLSSEPAFLSALWRCRPGQVPGAPADGTVFGPDEYDQRYKPGLWRQDQAFLRSVQEGRPAPFPASDLADAAQTMALIERVCGFPDASLAASAGTGC
jgi:predicted dehydrogenase